MCALANQLTQAVDADADTVQERSQNVLDNSLWRLEMYAIDIT